MYNEIWYQPGEPFPLATDIRKEVFIKEQGYTMDIEFDEEDKNALHLVLTDVQNTPVATARLTKIDEYTFVPGRIAVIASMRGKHLGELIVRKMIEKAIVLGAQQIQIGAQVQAIGFYEKLGLKVYGDEYMDGHVPHKKMQMNVQDYQPK